MLIMARSMRVEKARRDLQRLKEQRAEKRRKDELALEERMEKASEEHAEILFLYEQHVQGECYKTVEDADQGLATISSQAGKLKELKKHITIYVKGLGWSEYHTAWSVNGKPHSVEYLAHHLKYVITDSSLKNKQATKPAITLPSRRPLPSLGMQTVDARAKNEEDATLSNEMENKSNEERLRLINEGVRDEMRLRQPSCSPELEVGMKSQYAFRHTNEDETCETIEWCTGEVTKVSNGSNLRNAGNGPKYHRKGGAVEVQWEANEEKGEDISYSIVEIKKTLFNCYKECGWRLHFDIPWNSLPLQAACKAKENEEDQESAHDV